MVQYQSSQRVEEAIHNKLAFHSSMPLPISQNLIKKSLYTFLDLVKLSLFAKPARNINWNFNKNIDTF